MTRKSTWISILFTVSISLCLAASAIGQEISGSIVGTVRDSAGAVVPGATVTVTDPSKNDLVVRTLTATEEGEFSVPNLPIGSYTVTVEASNFKKSINTGIQVNVGERR